MLNGFKADLQSFYNKFSFILIYSFDTESTSKGEQQAEGKGETGSLLSRSLAPQAGSLMLG